MTMRRRDLIPILAAPAFAQTRRPRVAAIVTTYYFWSHADVILGRLMAGCSPHGKWHPNRCDVATLYMHQVHEKDMGGDLAARHGFRIVDSIEAAITPDIDAVCFVGEHGNYPNNDVGQKLYPRFELFSQILDVYEKRGRALPTFFDKHLSYSWDKAKAIYDRAARLKTPWMAGSSIPLSVRSPHWIPSLGEKMTGAVALGYGDNDAYGFHTLEALQSIVERRAGGETGITRVEMIEGPRALDQIHGVEPLVEAAYKTMPDAKQGHLEELVKKPVCFLVRYRDGFDAKCFLLNGAVQHWAVAAQSNGKINACMFGPAGKARPLPHFDGLVHNIEEMFLSGKPQYPVERTLLTTGALAHLFESKRAGRAIDTPGLAIRYDAPRVPFVQTA